MHRSLYLYLKNRYPDGYIDPININYKKNALNQLSALLSTAISRKNGRVDDKKKVFICSGKQTRRLPLPLLQILPIEKQSEEILGNAFREAS